MFATSVLVFVKIQQCTFCMVEMLSRAHEYMEHDVEDIQLPQEDSQKASASAEAVECTTLPRPSPFTPTEVSPYAVS